MMHFNTEMTIEQIAQIVDSHSDGKQYIAPAGQVFMAYKIAEKQIELFKVQIEIEKQNVAIGKRLNKATWALFVATVMLVILAGIQVVMMITNCPHE